MTERKAKEIELEEGIGVSNVPENGFDVEDVTQGVFIGLPEDEPDESVDPAETDEIVTHDE